ncbi:hypothetical protein AB0F72_20840 [Actinoplanes sp. NPDC023936]
MSSGLTEQIVREQEQVEQAADLLVEAALGQGGPDNVTVILMDVEAG